MPAGQPLNGMSDLRFAHMKHARVLAYLLLLISVTAGCTRFDTLNALVPSCWYRRTEGIAFGSLPRQKLDVFVPKDVKPHAGIVVFFYGGSWQYGSRNDYRFVGEALSSRGFIAVLPDYRVYPPDQFPAFLHDGALAVRWVHDNAQRLGGDVDHIYLMGHSAGAHIAVMLTLDPEYLKAVGLDRSAVRATAGISGPYDFLFGPDIRPVFGLKADDLSSKPWTQPINFIDGHAPPMLLLQGMKDEIVQPGNAARLAAKIRAAGGCVKCIEYPDRGHVGVVLALAKPFRWLAPVLDDTAAFFGRYQARW